MFSQQIERIPTPSRSDPDGAEHLPSRGGSPGARRADRYDACDDRSSAVRVSRLDEVGDRDGWRCWLCDEPVDPDRSVNDPRGPSIDSLTTKAKAKGKGRGSAPGAGEERLAHRSCNTKKGAVAAAVPWSGDLFVVDPAPIIASVDRLSRRGGREVMARCPTSQDASDAGEWLVDRISRLRPDMTVTTEIEPGGGQFLLVLRA